MSTHKKRTRVIAFLLLFMISLSMLVMPASAAPEAGSDASADASFYKLSSVASGYLSTALSKTDGDGWTVPSVDSGDAGGLLGYSDNADESGLIEGWISSALSASSVTFSYDALRNIQASEDGSMKTRNTNALWYYTQYGRLLKTIGFDSTSAETSMDFIRPAGGWLMKGAYYLASSVQSLFNIIVEFLHTLNPFRLFKSSNSKMDVAGVDYATESADPVLKDIGFYISAIYDTLLKFAPIIIGILFGILIIGIVVVNKSFGEAMPKIKKFLIRAVAIVIGIPILASVYTTMLTIMLPIGTDLGLFDSTPAATVVRSVFLDFESWAQKYRLSMPSSTDTTKPVMTCTSIWNGSGYRLVPTKETYQNLKATCLAINSSVSVLNTTKITEAGSVDDLLDRYTNGSFYYASSYEGYAKAYGAFTFDSFKETVEKTGTTVALFHDNVTTALMGTGLWSGATPGIYDVWTNGGKLVANETNTVDLDYSQAGKLSSMAMYNYLTSTFDDSSVTVYSNEKASSGYVRQSHHSVNIIGTGLLAFLYWLNAFTTLLCYAVLGWVYGMSIIFNAIKRLLHMVTAIPFAMLGSIRSIARVLIYSVMMLLEVVVTLFTYTLMCQLLSALTGLIETPFIGALTGESKAAADFAGTIVLGGQPMAVALDISGLLVVVLLFSTILLIIFCVQALKIKKAIVKFIDEMVTETIEKLFGVKSMADGISGPSAGARMAGAVGAGVGAGLAQKAMSGSNDKDHTDTKGVQGAPVGPDGDKPGGSGSDVKQEALPGGPALDSGNQMALESESGDVNINDADTATAAFAGNETESQAEIASADSMLSLSDGSDSEMSSEIQASDEAIEAPATDSAIAAGDEQQALDAAGADSADEVSAQAQDVGDVNAQAQDAGGVNAIPMLAGESGIKAPTGQTPEQLAKKNQNGAKPVSGQNPDPKAMPAGAGKAAIGPDGKPIAAPGVSGSEQKPAVAAASSANLTEAQQRNAAAKARLAALQGQAGATPVQAGQAAGQKTGDKNTAKPVGIGASPSTAAVAGAGNQPGNQPAGIQVQPTGQTAQPGITPQAQPGVAAPSSSQSVGSPAAQAMPVDSPSVPVQDSPQAVSMSASQSATVSVGSDSTPSVSSQPAPVGIIPGVQSQPGTQAQPGAIPAGVATSAPVSRVASVNPATAATAMPGRPSQIQPGTSPAPVAGSAGTTPVPSHAAPGHASMPAGQSQQTVAAPQSGVQHVQAGQQVPGVPGQVAAQYRPTGQQAPAIGSVAQAQQAAPQIQQVSQQQAAPVISQPSSQVVNQTLPQSPSRSGSAITGSEQATPGGGGQTLSRKQVKQAKKQAAQPTVAGAMAKAAVAAFMASSDSALVSGIGKGTQVHQQMQMFSQMQQRRGDDIVTPSTGADDIAAYDSETAAIESQIARLEAQNRMRQSGGSKTLGGKTETPKDESLL